MDKSLKFMIIIVPFTIFFGIFFGVELGVVRKTEYVPTICQCLTVNITSRYCCDLNCNKTCTDTQPDLQKCEVLISQSQSLSTDSCSRNSTLCPKSDSDAQCENNSCSCQMNCAACYDVKLDVMYFTGPYNQTLNSTFRENFTIHYIGQQQQNSTYTQSFKSLDDANIFFTAHEPNNLFMCYYNPLSVTEVILNRHYTVQWILLISLASALSLCFIIFGLSEYCYFYNDMEDSSGCRCIGFFTIEFICSGVIGILLMAFSVRNDGPIPKGEWNLLIVCILCYLVFVLFSITKEFLITIGFSKLQAIILTFIGVTTPIIIYIPIILYHPSLNTIILTLLTIQVVLVLVLIIFKCTNVNLLAIIENLIQLVRNNIMRF